jgi:hypothetical protein
METIEREFKCCVKFGSYQGEARIDFFRRVADALERCLDENCVADLCFFSLSKNGKKEYIKKAKVVKVNGCYFEIEDSTSSNNIKRYSYEESDQYYLHEVLVYKP